MEKEITRKYVESRCPVCTIRFLAKTRKAQYCSDACRQVAYRKRNLMYQDQQDDRDVLKNLQINYKELETSLYYARKECYELRKENRLLKEKLEQLVSL